MKFSWRACCDQKEGELDGCWIRVNICITGLTGLDLALGIGKVSPYCGTFCWVVGSVFFAGLPYSLWVTCFCFDPMTPVELAPARDLLFKQILLSHVLYDITSWCHL